MSIIDHLNCCKVCEEQQCDEAVFPLSISLLDQFLSDCLISKEQVQLAACVCLLLASKTRQCNHFSLELLSWYTDNSVSPQSLRVRIQKVHSYCSAPVRRERMIKVEVNFLSFFTIIKSNYPHAKSSLSLKGCSKL